MCVISFVNELVIEKEGKKCTKKTYDDVTILF